MSAEAVSYSPQALDRLAAFSSAQIRLDLASLEYEAAKRSYEHALGELRSAARLGHVQRAGVDRG